MTRNLNFTFFHTGLFALLIALRGNTQSTSLQNNDVSTVVSSTAEIFYLQEEEIVSSASVFPSTTMASLSPTFTNTYQYALSSWIYKTSWSGDWNMCFRISLNITYQLCFE